MHVLSAYGILVFFQWLIDKQIDQFLSSDLFYHGSLNDDVLGVLGDLVVLGVLDDLDAQDVQDVRDALDALWNFAGVVIVNDFLTGVSFDESIDIWKSDGNSLI